MKIYFKKINFYLIFALLLSFMSYSAQARLMKSKPKPVKPQSLLIVTSKLASDSIASVKALDEFSLFLEEQFRLTPHIRVVSSKKLKDYLKYHKLDIIKRSELIKGEVHLAKAKQSWFDQDYIGAKNFINKAIAQFKGRKNNGELLIDAYLTKLVILEKLKLKNQIPSVVSSIQVIDPYIDTSELPISNYSKINFKKLKKKKSLLELGSLQIESTPPGAEVQINGKKIGFTPMKAKDLPPGPYLVSLKANHYHDYDKNILITSGTEQNLKTNLKWNYKKKRRVPLLGIPGKTEESLQKDIKKLVQIGKRTKVDKVLWLVPQSHQGEENLIMRLIDTNLEASFNPVAIPLDKIINQDKLAYSKTHQQISKHFKVPVLNNPSKYLDPDYGQVNIMRQPMKWYKNPFILTGIGAAVIGGVVLGLSQGSSSSSNTNEGIVEVGFEGL